MTQKALVLTATLIATALLTPAVQAQPWTGAGPTAVIDEQSLGIYAANPQAISYNASGSTGNIIAYFNVTDTTGTGNPPWNTLQLGYFDSSPNSLLVAQLVQLNPCNGNLNVLCSVTSFDAAAPSCVQCNFAAGSVNFNAGLTYYVSVTMSRTVNTVFPRLFGVRVF